MFVFLLVDDYFLSVHDVNAAGGACHAAALEVVDGVVFGLSGGSDGADAGGFGFLEGSVEVNDEALGACDGCGQTEAGAVGFQFDGGSGARALFVKAEALVAAVRKDVIFVSGSANLLLGGCAHEEVARDVFLCARDIGLLGYGSVRWALEYEARLFR